MFEPGRLLARERSCDLAARAVQAGEKLLGVELPVECGVGRPACGFRLLNREGECHG